MTTDEVRGVGELQKDSSPAGTDDRHQQIERWFAGLWPHCDSIEASGFSVPSEGLSNAMLTFDLRWRESGHQQAQRFVMRFEPDDEPVAPKLSERHSTSVAFEFDLQDVLARHARCPVAALVGLESSDQILGRPFYVMQYIQGRALPSSGANVDSFLVHEANPEQRRRLVQSGLDAMMAVHSVDWRKAGLEWLDPSPAGAYRLAPQLASYREASVRHLHGLDHPVLFQAIDWLQEHEPADLLPSLAWGDSRPGNILFTSDYEVAAALDWEMAAIMPSDSDVALWLLTDYMVHEVEGAARLPGYPSRDEQLAYCEQRYGVPVRDLVYWEIFNAMKIAYVFVRLVRRMQDKGQVPAGDDSLILDNFAVRYVRDHIGSGRSGLLQP